MEFDTQKTLTLPNIATKRNRRDQQHFSPDSFQITQDKGFGNISLARRSRTIRRASKIASLTTAAGQQESRKGKKGEVVMTIASTSKYESLPVPAWRELLGNLGAGAIAGCTVEAVLYPIDTIKTRLQAMTSGGGASSLFRGTGMGRPYSGLLGNLVGVAPASGLFFMAYEPAKKAAKEYIPEDAAPLIAGAIAGLVASVVRVPTEVIKQRMQIREFNSAVSAVRVISRIEGVRGLYAGYGAFILRDLPFDAVEFFAYEALKSLYVKQVHRDIRAPEAAAVGAVAGGFTGLVTTPFDVLKTRLMTQGVSGRYSSIWDATTKMLAEEGPSAFFKGWQPRLVWISIGGCVFFTALEQSKKLLVPQEKSYR